MKKLFISSVFASFIFALASFVNPHAILAQVRYKDLIYPANQVSVQKAIPYKMVNGKNLLMDFYFAQGDATPDRPAIILLHSGGLTGGSRDSSDMISTATQLAKYGYVVISIDYTISKAPAFSQISETDVTNAKNDVIDAYKVIKQNAAGAKINPGKIFLFGLSAGAILSQHAGYDTSIDPAGIVSIAGEFMFNRMPASPPPKPYAILLHGEADNVVPYANDKKFHDELMQQGIPHTWLSAPNAGHYDLGPFISANFQRIINTMYLVTTQPQALGGANVCSLPPPGQSSISQYAKKRGITVGVLASECELYNAADKALCLQTISQNYSGMTSAVYVSSLDMYNSVLNFAKGNNMKLHWYHLVYNLPPYTPDLCAANPTAAGLEAAMKKQINDIISVGGSTVTGYNVVNEAFDDNGNIKNDCYKQRLGEGYIDRAFQYARQASPNGFLVLNDSFGNGRMIRAKIDGYFAYIKSAKSRGIPIDGAGFQDHLRSTTGEQFTQGYLDDLNYFMQKARDAGVKVLISEMDVYQAGHSQADVAKVYYDTMAACLKDSNCYGLETWGVSDKYSWLRTFPAFGTSLADAKPLLFDDNFQRKDAYYAVMQALRDNTTRSCDGTAPTPRPPLQGDLNGDGKVDATDIGLFRNSFSSNFGKTGSPGFVPADVNRDGVVNIYDYGTISDNYGK